MMRKLYPGGKHRAVNFSFDDGVVQDIRFVELLNKYGLKGTFNLNYGLMIQHFTWQHECGMTVKRLDENAVCGIYRGHEIASHSYSHPYFDNSPEEEILKELGADRFFLERLTGTEVEGYATPFYHYSDLMEDCVKKCGFRYARISEKTDDCSIPANFYCWKGSKFLWDEDLETFVRGFLETDRELALCQIVGHSYDLDVMDLWESMERICHGLASSGDVWAATHGQLVRYLQNMEMLSITGHEIKNESCAALWLELDGTVRKLEPGETIEIY